VLIGEGEATLGELLDWLTRIPERCAPLGCARDILGLAWPGGRTPRRLDITRLDDLPFPA
jgi:hypothetical protein